MFTQAPKNAPVDQQISPQLMMKQHSLLISLINNIETLLMNNANAESVNPLTTDIRVKIERLDFLVRNANFGAEFFSILDSWKKEWVMDVKKQETKSSTSYTLRYYNSIQLNNTPPILLHYQTLCEKYGKLKIYSELINYENKFPAIFTNENKVNTESALIIGKYACIIANILFTERNKINPSEYDDYGAAEIQEVLMVILNPMLQNKNLNDKETYHSLYRNIMKWDVKSDIGPKYGVIYKNSIFHNEVEEQQLREKLYAESDKEEYICSQVQKVLLDQLTTLKNDVIVEKENDDNQLIQKITSAINSFTR